MLGLIDYKNGIYAFDAGYVRPILAAIHMVEQNGRVALVDTGTNSSLPRTLAALAAIGRRPEDVDYVILTHIHLDHAGGAGAMIQAFPAARLVVHPRGSRHMAEPGKLMAGVSAVYGAETAQRLYGQLVPVPVERIIEASDGLELDLGGRILRCLDTPGHARHHICIVDTGTSGIFTGDMFGLSYREFDVAGRPFIFPTTTPVQFEPDAMQASIERLLALQPEAMYLTHYSRIGDVPTHGATLLRLLAAMVAIGEAEATPDDARHGRIKGRLTGLLRDELRQHGCTLPEAEMLALLETDLELNAQGLEVWLDTRRKH